MFLSNNHDAIKKKGSGSKVPQTASPSPSPSTGENLQYLAHLAVGTEGLK
jgi:hypothetical protein